MALLVGFFFFFSSRRRHTRCSRDWSSDVCSSDLAFTVAEKAGCRLVSTTFFHGTWVAGPDLDPERYAAFLRGVTRAVHRIKADKRRYVSYFKQGWAAGDPDVQALTPDDFNLGRIQLREPTPIPEDEARWAWNWMA